MGCNSEVPDGVTAERKPLGIAWNAEQHPPLNQSPSGGCPSSLGMNLSLFPGAADDAVIYRNHIMNCEGL